MQKMKVFTPKEVGLEDHMGRPMTKGIPLVVPNLAYYYRLSGRGSGTIRDLDPPVNESKNETNKPEVSISTETTVVEVSKKSVKRGK